MSQRLTPIQRNLLNNLHEEVVELKQLEKGNTVAKSLLENDFRLSDLDDTERREIASTLRRSIYTQMRILRLFKGQIAKQYLRELGM